MMIYFLSTLLVLQLAVVVWFVYKNLVTFSQNSLQKILTEIDLSKQIALELDKEIKLQHEEIANQRDAIIEINQKAYHINILVKYKHNLLKKIAKP